MSPLVPIAARLDARVPPEKLTRDGARISRKARWTLGGILAWSSPAWSEETPDLVPRPATPRVATQDAAVTPNAAVTPEAATQQTVDSRTVQSPVQVFVQADTDGCPSAASLAGQVNAYVGSAYAAAGPRVTEAEGTGEARRLLVTFGAQADGHRAEIFDLQAGAAPLLLRSHSQHATCAELGRLAALSISLLADDGPGADSKGRTPLPLAAVASSSAPPAERAAVSAPRDQTSGVSEKANALPSQTSALSADPSSSQDLPGNPPPRGPQGLWLEIGPSFEVGRLPGMGFGAELGLDYRVGPLSVGASASLLVAGGETFPPGTSGVTGLAPDLLAHGCWAALPPVEVCARGGYGWLVARGEGFAQNTEDLAGSALLGLGVRASLPLSRRTRPVAEPVVLDPALSPERATEVRSELARLDAALAEVPLRHRAILLLHDFEEVPMVEAAAALGIPLKTGYARLNVGRKLLRQHIRRLELTEGRMESGSFTAKGGVR